MILRQSARVVMEIDVEGKRKRVKPKKKWTDEIVSGKKLTV